MILSDKLPSTTLFEDESLSSESYLYEKKASYEHSSSFDSIQYIEVGKTEYKLIYPIKTATVYVQKQKIWVCHTSEFEYFGASKKDREDAVEKFKHKIHIRFQQLYSKRPFEMTEEEYHEWIKLANTIDLLNYKTTTPLETREIGCVSYKNLPYPYRIKWLTDENYIINPSEVPGELMSYRPGQWIEAVVERDPVNYKVLGISSTKKIRFHIPRSGEAKSYRDKMKKIKLKRTSD